MSSGAKTSFEISDIQEDDIALKLAVSICQRQAGLGPDQVSRKGASITITPSLFEAYLKCPTKCSLRWLGETSTGNECADFDRAQQASYETEGIKRLTQTLATNACVAGDSVTLTGKRAKWRVAIGPVARAGDLESTIEAIEQVPAESQDKQGQLIPIRFKRRFLNKHLKSVYRFYKEVSLREYCSNTHSS